MISFGIPPKPGEVTLETDKAIELLFLRGYSRDREALVAGAGFAIGSLLANECVTVEDATEIVGELTSQAQATYAAYNRAGGPAWVEAAQLASILHFGMEMGRITTVNVETA